MRNKISKRSQGTSEQDLRGRLHVRIGNHWKNELIGISKLAGFRFLKSSSSSIEDLKKLPADFVACNLSFHLDNDDDIIKAHGVHWHPTSDELAYKVNMSDMKHEATTKWQILSEISRLFDPLGLLAPVIITVKSMMQQLWLTGCGWDDKLQQNMRRVATFGIWARTFHHGAAWILGRVKIDVCGMCVYSNHTLGWDDSN